MKLSVSANQIQDLPVAAIHRTCADSPSNVLKDTETGEARLEEMGKTPLGEDQAESNSELAPKIVGPLLLEIVVTMAVVETK